jgi:hypothetical protein
MHISAKYAHLCKICTFIFARYAHLHKICTFMQYIMYTYARYVHLCKISINYAKYAYLSKIYIIVHILHNMQDIHNYAKYA